MGLIELLLAILVLSWIGGFAMNIGGNLIHLLLVVALVVFVARFFRSSTL